ncbi:hypothetical protein [Microcoleus sp. N3A4]|uniref:hypothetical protein n=1 Tax=Microcoleus sp. N3A4 TaxID=3055379 RepID=UPI002FD2F8C5
MPCPYRYRGRAIGFEMIWGCRGAIDISCVYCRSVPSVGRGLRCASVVGRRVMSAVFYEFCRGDGTPKTSALKTWMVWHQQSQPEKLIALFARDKEHGRRG